MINKEQYKLLKKFYKHSTLSEDLFTEGQLSKINQLCFLSFLVKNIKVKNEEIIVCFSISELGKIEIEEFKRIQTKNRSTIISNIISALALGVSITALIVSLS